MSPGLPGAQIQLFQTPWGPKIFVLKTSKNLVLNAPVPKIICLKNPRYHLLDLCIYMENLQIIIEGLHKLDPDGHKKRQLWLDTKQLPRSSKIARCQNNLSFPIQNVRRTK